MIIWIGLRSVRFSSVIDKTETETDLPIIVFANFIDILPIISATNDGRRTKLLPSEPSRYDESNDSSFVFPSSFFTEIIGKMSKNWPFYRRFADYFGIQW